MEGINLYAFADEASPMIEKQIAAMKRNNLQGIEIRGVDGVNVSSISLQKAKEVKKKLDDAGLVTWSVGSPIGKISIEDAFAPHLEQWKHTLEIAYVLEAKNIRLFSFYIPAAFRHEDCKDEVMERLAGLIDAARGSGVTLCHENEKGIYGDIPERCLEIHRSFPEIKGVFDPANYIQCGVDTEKSWTMLKNYIAYLHIKDARSDGTVVPAGMGDGHVARIAREFMEAGGNSFTIEPHLTIFQGLEHMERKGEKTKMEFLYPDGDTAFDAACNAFRNLLP